MSTSMTVQSKDDLQRVELGFRSDDPSDAFARAEEFMEFFRRNSMSLGRDDISIHFVSISLPRMVLNLLKRGDLDQDLEERAYQFLRNTLIFIAHFLDTGVDELAMILEHVFDQRTQPFYANSTGELYEEISDLAAPRDRDAFEDEGKMHEAVFAELGQGRTRKGRDYNVEGRFISNINAFGRWNGFRRIRDAIVQQQQAPSRLQKIHYLLNPMYKVKDFLTTEFLDWFMDIFPQTTTMILNLSDEELKAEAAKVNDIVDILCTLYRLTSRLDSPEVVDKFRLDLALKGLRSTYLERRLTGLGDINEFVEIFSRQQTHASQMQLDEQGGGACIAQDYMCDWLMSNKILDEIFVRNVHTEVLKRSIKVLSFLASNRRLGELEVKMIWDASIGQHESISKMIHELLQKTAGQLHTPDVLLRMLFLIRQQPVSSLTAQHLHLAKRIATILMQLGTRMQQMQMADQFAGVDFLWEIMQDELRLGPIELQNICITAFAQLMGMAESRIVRVQYFEKCVKNIKEHKSVVQSLVVMNGLFLSLSSKRKKPDVDWSTFGCVNDEQELLSLIIEDLVQYRNGSEDGGTPRNQTPREAVGTPRGLLVRRQDQISKRLEFITSILQVQGTSLSEQHLETMWTALVQPGIDERQRDVSLKWFYTLLENQGTSEAMSQSLEPLFRLTCNLNSSEMSECAFDLFRRTFLLVNLNHGNIVYEGPERNRMIVATREKLLGTDFLWQFSLSAVSADHAIGLLNDIYLGVSSNLPSHLHVLQERRQEHMATCLDHMLRAADDLSKGDVVAPARSIDVRERTQNENRIGRCISVLRKFLHDYELRTAALQPDFSIRKHGRQLLGGQISVKLQQFGQTAGEAVVMQIDRGATLSLLREFAGKAVGEDPRSLRMIAKGKELKGDEKTVAEFRLCDADTVHWTKKCGDAQGVSENDANIEAGPAAHFKQKSCEFRSPHDILSQDHFDKIFNLLDMPAKISTQVWELLMVLPTNVRLMQSIRALGPSLATTLCPPGVFTQLYTLQIVEILLFEDDNSKPSWRFNFIKSGGANHLLDMILSQRFSKQDSDQCNDCLAKLLNLLFITMIESHRNKAGIEIPAIPGIESCFKDSLQAENFVHMLLETIRVSAAATNLYLDANAADTSAAFAAACGEKRSRVAGRVEGHESVASNAMRLLVACILRARQMATYICTFESIRDWLADSIVRTQNAGIRQVVCQGVVKLAGPEDQAWQAHLSSCNSANSPSCLHPHIFFLEHLLSLVCDVKPGTSNCTDFFDLVNQMVSMTDQLLKSMMKESSVPAALLLFLNNHFDRTAKVLVEHVKNSPILEERNGTKEDEVLIGHLIILRSIFALRPQLKDELGGCATMHHPQRSGLLGYLTSECLFGLPSVDQYALFGPPKCKLPKTRSAAFELLFVLAEACPSNQEELLTLLHQQHLRREYRALYMYRPWLFDRAPCGFVGLRNLGATCYMNSLLQQLFFVPECRIAMLQVKVEDRESFIYQLQLLFAHLQESEKQFYDPSDLCQVYTDYDGQPVNICQQMDVDEFLNVLFEKVEQGLRNTPQKDLLRNCFGGKIVHQIICKEPVTVGDRVFTVEDPYKSEREESFYTLQLEVKHKRSILESLRLYVDDEGLEGDNKYLCEEANKKVDAVKRICIKELPQTLILHLKRFEFDLDFMKKVKVNDCCEFPLTLDMDPYTLNGIERRERAAAEAVQKGLDGIKAMEEVESVPDSEYELVGVLVHTGTADSGHYYSYIKERSKEDEGVQPKWHLFNDIHVEPFDCQELGAASFGGSEYLEEAGGPDSARPHTKLVSRSYSAYMLFYGRRSAKTTGPGRALSCEKLLKAPSSKDVVNIVLEENIRFLRDKHTYDPEYFGFLKNVCRMPLDDARDDKATMLAVHVLMDCVIHSWDTGHVCEWVSIIQSKLSPHDDKVNRSKWLLDTFIQAVEFDGRVYGQHWLKKALLSHRVQEFRLSIVPLLLHAIQNLAASERENSLTRGAVPYCAMDEVHDNEIQVLQDGQLVPSLMTDHPYARAREYRGSPFPRPVTTVGRFIDSVLDLLPEVPRYWRYYSEYFQLLASFANMSVAEKVFLLSRRTISRSIDCVLLDESLASGSRNRNNLGDQFAVPDNNNLLALITTLVRSVKLERDLDDDDEVPTQLCVAGPLDPACCAYMKKPRLLTKILSEGIYPTQTMMLLEHMCWNNSKQSCAIIETLIAVLDDAHEDEMDTLLKMLDTLMSMSDMCQELRAERMVTLFLRMILDKVLYADICTRCLEFLECLVARNKFVRSEALTLIISPRREQQMQSRWFEGCLIRSEMEKVQMAWEKFARTLALPEIYLMKMSQQQASQQQGKTGGRMAPLPKVHGDKCTQSLFEHLITKNDKIVLMGCADTRETGCCNYPLKYYLKLLSFVIENTHDRWYKDKFRERLRLFHDVLRRLNENEFETDFAKAEVHRLLLLASEGCPETLDVYTDERSPMRSTLVSNFILIRPHRINIAFNRQHLPFFYRLLLVCCQHSKSFVELLMEANEFMWSITHLMCKSTKYPETCAVILELIDVILGSDAQAGKVANFRARVLEMLLNAKDLSASPECVLELSNRFVLHLLEDTDGLHKVLDSNLFDALLAAVGSCYPQQVTGGQRPRTQPEARAFSVALQALEVLKRILDAVKSIAAVDSGDKEFVEKALSEALLRSKSIACDHRHKAMSAIMFVVLPTADVLPTRQRLMALDVTNTLCCLDVDCCMTAATALFKLYEETKLRSVELVRLEHLQGTTQRDAKSSQQGVSTDVKKIEQAWLHISHRAKVQDATRVVEFGPACRARTQGMAQERKDVEAAYCTLALTLCKKYIAFSKRSSDSTRCAVHLILKCAIDILPLATLPGHTAMQELLLECVTASLRAEGKRQESASDSTSHLLSSLPNSPLFVQFVRQETLAYDWVERVLLCYKEAIELTRLQTCAQLMLATLAPAWPSEVLRRINDFLVADLTELANAAGVLKEAGGVDAVAPANQRAEAVAGALLRELRPLAVVNEAPLLLAALVDNHGESACATAAEEALRAADCRKYAANSKVLTKYLTEIDHILHTHCEAVKRSKTQKRDEGRD